MTSADRLCIDGADLEYRFAGRPGVRRTPIVMLHEGLGSMSMWKDFPERLADATGCRVLVYSRRGYGGSSPLTGSRGPDYLHEEARRWLPAVLERLGLRRPMLFGHSDGASIALIYAADPGAAVSGVVALAPHVMVEDVTITGIARTKLAYESGSLRKRLAVYHDDVDGVFLGWNRIWLDPAFRDWNIEGLLPAITAPIVAIQGVDDEYATLAQIERIRYALPRTELLALPACGHSPHRDQPVAVLEAARHLIERIER